MSVDFRYYEHNVLHTHLRILTAKILTVISILREIEIEVVML